MHKTSCNKVALACYAIQDVPKAVLILVTPKQLESEAFWTNVAIRMQPAMKAQFPDSGLFVFYFLYLPQHAGEKAHYTCCPMWMQADANAQDKAQAEAYMKCMQNTDYCAQMVRASTVDRKPLQYAIYDFGTRVTAFSANVPDNVSVSKFTGV
jgi:hypothetical protein